MCLPNNVKPLASTCAAICAGPVSLAITNELSLIKEVDQKYLMLFHYLVKLEH